MKPTETWIQEIFSHKQLNCQFCCKAYQSSLRITCQCGEFFYFLKEDLYELKYSPHPFLQQLREIINLPVELDWYSSSVFQERLLNVFNHPRMIKTMLDMKSLW